jgi:hypothetical protein
MNHI